MTAYLDTSLLISLLAEDRHTPRAQAWSGQGGRVTISTWALVEVSSVLGLKVRQGVLTPAQHEQAESRVALLAANPLVIAPTKPIDMIAARTLVLSSRNLRAPDALHLAIAMRLSLDLATFDDGLKQAAAAVGCGIVAL